MEQNFEVKNTGKYGNGVYATQNIKKGSLVHVFAGERMDINALIVKLNTQQENLDDPFQIGKRTYLDLDELSRSFNHSCSPNTGIKRNYDMLAIKDIKIGEEITYDYSLTVAPLPWEMACACSSAQCRKVIRDVSSIPSEQLHYYQKIGAIQTYMKKIIKELKVGTYTIPPYTQKALQSLIKR